MFMLELMLERVKEKKQVFIKFNNKICIILADTNKK